MCTAIRYGGMFGRNFDLDFEFEQNILFTPRNFEIKRRNAPDIREHYAIMGMGICIEDFPLYYDAMNEKGLGMAGLNFPGYAEYNGIDTIKENIATFELIPSVLGTSKNVSEAVKYLKGINITSLPFSDVYPTTPLHWMIADKERSVIVECDKRGICVYEDSADLLTNSPSYDIQLLNLANFRSVSPKAPGNSFSDKLSLSCYSFGMGGIGLPGDLSSMSRFVKGVFLLHNSPEFESCEEHFAHFYRLLYAVAMTKGAVLTEGGKSEFTQYSCCMELTKSEYSFTSYDHLEPKRFSFEDFNINSNEIQQKGR